MEPFRERHATTPPTLRVRLQPLSFIVPDFGHENHSPVEVHTLTLQPDSFTPPTRRVGAYVGEVTPCRDEVRAHPFYFSFCQIPLVRCLAGRHPHALRGVRWD